MKKLFFRAIVMSLIMTFQLSFAQKTVSGTVTDSSGVPLPGATVVVQGTSNGVTTNFDGIYSISANEGDQLVASFVGYASVSATVGASSTLDFSLSPDNSLEEVVVTALGITRAAKSLGFAQQAVSGDALTKTKETDFRTALAGKVAGVQVIGGTSSTFEPSAIRLRGEQNVLYVVDGIPMSSTDINTAIIDNITVLKGAAATALYGYDARSGVIVITTKKAKRGETYISVDHNTVLSEVNRLPNYQNEYGGGYYQSWDTFTYNPNTDPAEWAAFNGHYVPYYAADESWGPKMDGTLVRHWDSWIPDHPDFGTLRPWSPNPDNVKNFFNLGVKNTTSLSFAKGGEDYSFRASARASQDEAVVPNATRDVYDLNINGEIKLTDDISIYSSLNARLQQTDNYVSSGYGSLASNFSQWWQRQLDMDRLEKNYYYNGVFYTWNRRSARNARPQYWDAPHYEQYFNTNANENSTYSGNFGINIDLADNLTANVEVKRRAYTRHNWGRSYVGVNTLNQTPGYSEGSYNQSFNQLLAKLNYSLDITEDLDLTAIVGYTADQNKWVSTSANTVGGLQIPDFYTIRNSKDKPNYSTSRTNTKYRSAFANASVGYKDLLFVDGSYRFDWGSTANPDNNRIETFQISGSFIFSNLIDLPSLTFGKLRAGYAESPIFPGAYATNQTYSTGTSYGSLPSMAVPNTLANPNLTGGLRTETEYGVELKFFDNRFGIDFTYFDREDSNLPVSVTAPASSGYSRLSVNSKVTSSDGIELAISGTPILTDNFRWDLSANVGTLTKTVDFIYEGIDRVIINSWLSWSSMDLQEIVGEEWGILYGRKRRTDANGNYVYNSSGTYAYDNNQILGNIMPDATGGITSSMQYKNWDLSIGIDWQDGGLYHSVTDMFSVAAGMHAWTAGVNDKGNPKRDPVSSGGGIHQVGVYTDGSPADFYMAPDSWAWGNWTRDDLWLVDASFVKLRQVRLGYSFDSNSLDKTPFSSINVALIGNNLGLLYENSQWDGGIDPSEMGSNWSGNNFASEGGQMPSARSVGLNISLQF
jgi:TonB-linked SusC/RagA family outer membrane protein